MRASLFALAALALGVAAPTAAQTPVRERDEEVIVRGAPPAEVVRSFVNQMAISSQSANQMARWDRRICPGIAGLKARYAQFLLDRMAQRALDVDLDVGRPGCRANILIIVSPDPDAIARELATRHSRAMGVLNVRGRYSLGRGQLQRFVESDAPVRWWHVNRTMTRDGEIMDGAPPSPGGFFIPGQTTRLPSGVSVMTMSGARTRLGSMTRQDFAAAFVVVDARALEGINYNWEGLADYLAMVALAQLDPQAETAEFPTILNMFSRGETVRALTDWDVAYLRGLYSATRDARGSIQQEGEIARSMGRELTE